MSEKIKLVKVTIHQKPEKRVMGSIMDDKQILVPITSIAYLNFRINNQYDVVLKSDVNIAPLISIPASDCYLTIHNIADYEVIG